MKSILLAAMMAVAVIGWAWYEPNQGAQRGGVISEQLWSTVPAPTAPMRLTTQDSPAHASDHTWNYPYTKPTPACTLKVQNALITDNKVGQWSEPVTLKTESGWRLWGGAWNQPITEHAQGVAWRAEISELSPADDFPYNPYQNGKVIYLYTGWGGSYYHNDTAPVSGHMPYVQQLTEDAWRQYMVEDFKEGGAGGVAPPPVVFASNVPNVQTEVAYARVTETGETALSPAFIYTPAVLAGTTPARTCWLTASISEWHPQGTIGYHVYIRPTGGQWQRVPSPDCHGTPVTADDWLFPWWRRQITINRVVPNAPTHSPAVTPKSRLNWLHRMLRGDPVKDADVLFEYLRGPDVVTKLADGTIDVRRTYDPNYVEVDAAGMPVRMKRVYVGDVVVKPGRQFTAYCPVVDEWGNGDSGTTGGEGDQKFGRRIRAADFGSWRLIQAPSQGGHTAWPVLAIANSYSRWYGVIVNANGGDALAFTDYSGGQCFGNQFHECQFRAATIAGRVTCGIRIDDTCTSAGGGHTPSEQLYSDCAAVGSIGAYIGGNQTANLRFRRLHINSYSRDSRGSVFYISCPNPLKFYDGLYCDAYLMNQPQDLQRGVIFRTGGYGSNLQVEGIWCDTGFIRFIECNAVDGCQLDLRGGKINMRGTRPALGLFVGHQRHKSTWYIEGVQVQPDPGTQHARIESSSWRMAEILTERTYLENVVLREQDEAATLARMQELSSWASTVQPRAEPGYKTPTGQAYNSLTTGRKITTEIRP